jgi:REP element-mobilizing transposase RayT
MYDDEFNENHIPLAYLITFRSYGTWLHGDERGSVDRDHNVWGTPYAPRDEVRKAAARERMKYPPVILNVSGCVAVDAAIREVCQFRHWGLRALNVRTNHAHAVVSAACHPEKVLNDFKAYATRRLRRDGLWQEPHSPWAEGGSKRYLWYERQVERAIHYVLYHQGVDLIPDFTDDDLWVGNVYTPKQGNE